MQQLEEQAAINDFVSEDYVQLSVKTICSEMFSC